MNMFESGPMKERCNSEEISFLPIIIKRSRGHNFTVMESE